MSIVHEWKLCIEKDICSQELIYRGNENVTIRFDESQLSSEHQEKDNELGTSTIRIPLHILKKFIELIGEGE